MALTFLGISLVCAVVIRVVDHHDFHSLGLALWWALQTVTTVGYGDIVPTTTVGRVFGALEMVIGVSFIAFLTAGVTSVTVWREQQRAQAASPAPSAVDSQLVLDALAEMRQLMAEMDQRLARIESRPKI
jgi:voltage-gated potassium channel